MGIASLVLGIVSVVIAVLFSGFGWLGGIIGVVGIVFAVIARKKQPSSVATAGLVLSIIGAALGFILYIACVAAVGCVSSAISA